MCDEFLIAILQTTTETFPRYGFWGFYLGMPVDKTGLSAGLIYPIFMQILKYILFQVFIAIFIVVKFIK